MKYMDLSPEDRIARSRYVDELVGETAPNVWLGLSGNGSVRIAIDSDVQCYGPWEPHGSVKYSSAEGRVQEAQSWVEYFVRSTINRLLDADLLNVPGDD